MLEGSARTNLTIASQLMGIVSRAVPNPARAAEMLVFAAVIIRETFGIDTPIQRMGDDAAQYLRRVKAHMPKIVQEQQDEASDDITKLRPRG